MRPAAETASVVERITCRADLDAQIAALCAADQALAREIALLDEVPLRLLPPGFEGLSQIVISQLLSVASAKSIFARYQAVLGAVNPENFLALDEASIRGAGLTAAKYRCLKTLAEAELSGALSHEALAHLPDDEALKTLMAYPGIGLWSAEIYLLFCAGHADMFPAGDLVLRKMVGQLAGLEQMPDIVQTQHIAQKWSPWRGTAARALWAIYARQTQKEGTGF